MSGSGPSPSKRPRRNECFFGAKCYRRNPHHFKEFEHEHLQRLVDKYGSASPPDHELADFEAEKSVVREQLKVYREVRKIPENSAAENGTASIPKANGVNSSVGSSEKHVKQAPLSLFLTKIRSSPSTHSDPGSVFLTDLLHKSMGALKQSLQINFLVEWDFVHMAYEATENESKPMLLLHGDELDVASLPSNVRAIRVKPRYPFGTHHTKMMVLLYDDDSVRVVVHTANLRGSDWENRTQAAWVSPRCKKMTTGAANANAGDSKTGFKAALLRYLRFYELDALRPYIFAVQACDFSAVNVHFVSSVPGSHRGSNLNLWGHCSAAAILKAASIPEEVDSWPVTAQCSSIGSLGKTEEAWLRGEFALSLSHTSKSRPALQSRPPALNLVYPSKQDVLSSYEGVLGGACLPYSRSTHEKQPWLRQLLFSWRAESTSRTRAPPHVKTYSRFSPDGKRAAFLLLTSANLSKAAWGSLSKNRDSLLIMSYEAGVLFLPGEMSGAQFFTLGKDLRLPYDVPLTKYSQDDSPWFMDYLQEALK